MKSIFHNSKVVLLLLQMLSGGNAAGVRGAQELATSEIGYGVNTFVCDQNLERIHESISKKQGSVFKLCFEPNEKAIEDGVGIKSIDSFTWKRGDSVEQFAVVDGEDFVLSTSQCGTGKNKRMCSLETMLGGAFYRNRGPVTGLGTATMIGSDSLHVVQLIYDDWHQLNIEFVTATTDTAIENGSFESLMKDGGDSVETTVVVASTSERGDGNK